jgi:MoaA/NifB/PqqE/SkfB family radical SAM enzyme
MPGPIEAARRYLALARSVRRARQGPWQPFKLTWILTEVCSLRCRTCQLWVGEPARGPDLATVDQVIAANPHLTWVNLSGGDFVERPDADRLVERVTEGLPDLALFDFPTAGQDTEATLRALQPALDSDVPRIYVTVSIDGDDDVHDRIRGVRGSAARARATLRRLQSIRRRGFQATAGMTLSRHNLPATVPDDPGDLLPAHLDAAQLHLNLAHHSEHYYRNQTDVVPPEEPALALIDHVQSRRKGLSPLAWIERRYWTVARRYLSTGDVGGHCAALQASVYLAADMTVYPCSIFDHPLGHLGQVDWDLTRLAELPGAEAGRRGVVERTCPSCWSPCEAFPTLLVGLGRPL